MTTAATTPPMSIGLVKIPETEDGEATVRGMVLSCDREPIVAFRVIV
jgi:hypothetical protein